MICAPVRYATHLSSQQARENGTEIVENVQAILKSTINVYYIDYQLLQYTSDNVSILKCFCFYYHH